MPTHRCSTMVVLTYVNLLNYVDRYTVAGLLSDIQDYYDLTNDMVGLLQTAFILSYMVFAPLFGYLGDRYSRRAVMAVGVSLWTMTTLLGSFMVEYPWFLLCRGLVGVGEASFTTIAPTIISDLFVRDRRSTMLALFYFTIPVGSGLGYVLGSETANVTGAWQNGLRVTPVLGIVSVVLILFVMTEPERGESEGKRHLHATSWFRDIAMLLHNPSFVLSTAGFTCTAFVGGGLAWWGPNFIYLGLRLQPGNENINPSSVCYQFGIIAMTAGLIGVPAGSFIAQRLRKHYPRADPCICGFGLICSAPMIFASMIFVTSNTVICYVCMFIGEVLLNLNWSVEVDILLYIIAPTRRSTATAFQMLFAILFGNAASPYFLGLLSEILKTSMASGTKVMALTYSMPSVTEVRANQHSHEIQFRGLQYAMFTTSFMEVLGGLFFLVTALYIVQDKENAAKELEELASPRPSTDKGSADPPQSSTTQQTLKQPLPKESESL